MIISRSTHVAAKGIILFFFYGSVVSHCIYLLYPFICWWTFKLFWSHFFFLNLKMKNEINDQTREEGEERGIKLGSSNGNWRRKIIWIYWIINSSDTLHHLMTPHLEHGHWKRERPTVRIRRFVASRWSRTCSVCPVWATGWSLPLPGGLTWFRYLPLW